MDAVAWIALGSTLAVVLIAGIGGFWQVNRTTSEKLAHLHAKIEGVKDNYVRRDDLTALVANIKDDTSRIERSQENLAAKMDSTTGAVINAMAKMTEAAVALRKD